MITGVAALGAAIAVSGLTARARRAEADAVQAAATPPATPPVPELELING